VPISTEIGYRVRTTTSSTIANAARRNGVEYVAVLRRACALCRSDDCASPHWGVQSGDAGWSWLSRHDLDARTFRGEILNFLNSW